MKSAFRIRAHHHPPSQSSATIILLRSSVVTPNPNSSRRACWFPFLFVCDTLAVTRTHTQKHTHTRRKTPVTMYLCLRRDALPILANLRGALITLCLLALVNTMTTWQRLKSPKHCYYFPIQRGEDTEHNPHCWPRTHQCVICRADVEKKKKKLHRRRNAADGRVTFGQRLSICLALSPRVCSI